MDKTVRSCAECAEDLKEGFTVTKVGTLRIESGICGVCGQRRQLETYKIESKRKERETGQWRCE